MTISKLMMMAAALLWIGSFAVAQDAPAQQGACPLAAQRDVKADAKGACGQACGGECGETYADENQDGVCDHRQADAPARAAKREAKRGPRLSDENKGDVRNHRQADAPARAAKREAKRGPRFVDRNNDGVCDQRQSMRPPAARLNRGCCPQCGRAWESPQNQPFRGSPMRGYARGQGPMWGPPMAFHGGQGFGRGQGRMWGQPQTPQQSAQPPQSGPGFGRGQGCRMGGQPQAEQQPAQPPQGGPGFGRGRGPMGGPAARGRGFVDQNNDGVCDRQQQ